MNFPFEVTVYVQQRPHMRDENLEYESYIGKSILHRIFDEERVDDSIVNATFIYPERWMNIVEERSLYDRLAKYCPNLKTVTIVTQSVYILQCTAGKSIKIVMSKDQQDRVASEGGLTQESDTGRLWYKNAMVSDFFKIQTFDGL